MIKDTNITFLMNNIMISNSAPYTKKRLFEIMGRIYQLETEDFEELKKSFLHYKNEYNKKCFPSQKYHVYNSDGNKRICSIPNPFIYMEFVKKTINNLQFFSNLYSKLGEENIVFNQSRFIDTDGKLYSHYGIYGEEVVEVEDYRLIKNIPFVLNAKKNLELNIKYKYKLKTDITSFYNSIYTHVLERIGEYISYYMDIDNNTQEYIAWLDTYNRSINNAETNGIITGAFSSVISSEVILLYIDFKIVDYIKEKNYQMKYTRYVDDYTFYCNDERNLVNIQEKLSEFLDEVRLELNYRKTCISDKVDIKRDIRIKNLTIIDKIVNFEREKEKLKKYYPYLEDYELDEEVKIEGLRILISEIEEYIQHGEFSNVNLFLQQFGKQYRSSTLAVVIDSKFDDFIKSKVSDYTSYKDLYIDYFSNLIDRFPYLIEGYNKGMNCSFPLIIDDSAHKGSVLMLDEELKKNKGNANAKANTYIVEPGWINNLFEKKNLINIKNPALKFVLYNDMSYINQNKEKIDVYS